MVSALDRAINKAAPSIRAVSTCEVHKTFRLLKCGKSIRELAFAIEAPSALNVFVFGPREPGGIDDLGIRNEFLDVGG